MKKFLSFVVVSSFLFGVLAFAKDSNENKNVNDNNNRQESSSHTGTQFGGKYFTGINTPLSTGAIACITTAIVKRDATIGSGMNIYHASWTVAFATRTNSLVAALSLANKKEIKTAMNLAWKTSERTIKLAQKVKRGVVQTAWSSYRVDLKACNADMAKDLMQERGGNDLDD